MPRNFHEEDASPGVLASKPIAHSLTRRSTRHQNRVLLSEKAKNEAIFREDQSWKPAAKCPFAPWK